MMPLNNRIPLRNDSCERRGVYDGEHYTWCPLYQATYAKNKPMVPGNAVRPGGAFRRTKWIDIAKSNTIYA